jgi:hypothetical protein
MLQSLYISVSVAIGYRAGATQPHLLERVVIRMNLDLENLARTSFLRRFLMTKER